MAWLSPLVAAVTRLMAIETCPHTASLDRLDRLRRSPPVARLKTWRITTCLGDDQIGPPLIGREVIGATPLVIVLPVAALRVERPPPRSYPCAVVPPRREMPLMGVP